MGTTHKMLAKRVEELTDALAEVREDARDISEAGKLAEASAYANDIVEYIDELIGPTEDEEESERDE